MAAVLSPKWPVVKAIIDARLADAGQTKDGREEELLKLVLENADESPESVLKTIDAYAQRSWMMNIGQEKGGILVKTLTAANPKNVLELGAYVGYSATLISSKLQAGAKLISVEISELNASITRQVVRHAGLSEKVEVVQGILIDKIDEVKKQLHQQNGTTFDFVFLDHDKDCYLHDFLTLKEHGLVGKGTVIFADNMGMPDSPKFREYMNQHTDEYDTVEIKTVVEYINWLTDSIFVSTCK